MSGREDFDPEKTCNDCGGAPPWRWRNRQQPNYCARCLNKAGHEVYVASGIDQLAELVGDETTLKILRATGFFEEDENAK